MCFNIPNGQKLVPSGSLVCSSEVLDFAHDPRFTKKTSGWGIYGEQPPVALNDQTTEMIVGKYNTRTKVFPLD